MGRQINGWMVLDCVGRFENTYIYECRCEHCGHISYKTAGELSASKGGDCQYCRPDYHFQIHGNYAVGTLTNGRAFIIDTVMVTQVKKRRWRQDAKGYIVSFDNGEKIFLHRFVLGRTNAESICVDHINRSKSDCRSSNLRVVSLQQNAMNRSIGKNNTSGYVGVCYDKRGQRFVARIGLNNHYYFLGSSVDAIQCAQMYNYAAQQIFRQFAGHQNDVPPISEKLRKKMDQKLAPLILSAEIATNPV